MEAWEPSIQHQSQSPELGHLSPQFASLGPAPQPHKLHPHMPEQPVPGPFLCPQVSGLLGWVAGFNLGWADPRHALVPQQEAATGSLTDSSRDEEPEEPALDTREGQGGTEVQIQASQRQGPKSLVTALPCL